MDFSAWTAAVLATKWLLYAAVALATGAPAAAWQLAAHAGDDWRRRTLRLALGGCVAGLVATALHFLMLLGDFARAGFGGLLDATLARLLWDSPVGTALILRGAGFVILAIAAGGAIAGRARSYGAVAMWLSGSGLLAASFAVGGHAAERGGAAPYLVAVHVLAMAWWLGALVPLLQACRSLDRAALHAAMERFGRLARIPVALLIACGVVLVAMLIESPRALLEGAWSLTLGSKLLAVGGMLLFAALHRWRLVPQLGAARDTAPLRRSIAAETLLAVLVLAATATLSTAFGPAGM